MCSPHIPDTSLAWHISATSFKHRILFQWLPLSKSYNKKVKNDSSQLSTMQRLFSEAHKPWSMALVTVPARSTLRSPTKCIRIRPPGCAWTFGGYQDPKPQSTSKMCPEPCCQSNKCARGSRRWCGLRTCTTAGAAMKGSMMCAIILINILGRGTTAKLETHK